MKMMAKVAKGLMLAAFMVAGMTTVNAQETTYTPTAANQWWNGEDESKLNEAYLFNVGAKIFATNNTPSVNDIEKANLWSIGSDKTFTNKVTKEVIYMHSFINAGVTWTAEISNKNATSFKLETGTSTDKGLAYCLTKSESIFTRYFNVDGDSYSAAQSQSPYNDWLFISETQKSTYNEYKDLFNELKGYLANEFVVADAEKTAEIEGVLTATSAKSNSYNTYNKAENGDKTQLENKIATIKAFIETATGIKNINAATSTEASATYDLNGVRKSQLTKGINIVKMTDGKVKKVLVK